MNDEDEADEALQRILLETTGARTSSSKRKPEPECIVLDDDDDKSNTGNHPTTSKQDLGYLQAQRELLGRYRRQHARAPKQQDESAAVAAAIAASEYEEQQRQRRRQQQQQERERKRRRTEQQKAQQQQSKVVAEHLHREELSAADQELATAIQQSAQHAEGIRANRDMEQSVVSLHLARTQERHAGSWDCPHCTFANPPFVPKCRACQQQPNKAVLVFQPIPPRLRFGLELEMYIEDGKHDGFDLQWLATELTKLGPPRVEFHGYSHETTLDCWKIVTDSSVQGSSGAAGQQQRDRDLCFELVSPILYEHDESVDSTTDNTTRGGLEQLRIVLENVRRLGIATNATCGFHVHVDATSGNDQAVAALGTLNGVKAVAQCFVALENAFDLLVRHSPTRNTNRNVFCQSNRMAFGMLSNRQRWERLEQVTSYQELVDAMNPSGDRYHKLNLTNMVRPNRAPTCEFRHHGGVEQLCEAEAWVRLVLRFCDRAATMSQSCSARYLREAATPADELRALFDLVQCPGLEQFYSVERKLFVPEKQLRHDWECRCCRRNFGSSRALAQHASATGHWQ